MNTNWLARFAPHINAPACFAHLTTTTKRISHTAAEAGMIHQSLWCNTAEMEVIKIQVNKSQMLNIK